MQKFSKKEEVHPGNTPKWIPERFKELHFKLPSTLTGVSRKCLTFTCPFQGQWTQRAVEENIFLENCSKRKDSSCPLANLVAEVLRHIICSALWLTASKLFSSKNIAEKRNLAEPHRFRSELNLLMEFSATELPADTAEGWLLLPPLL